ncbi:hypothetical protein ACWDA3_53440 [Nonomuraea rubra]
MKNKVPSPPGPTGLDIALQWSQLPSEHLQAALAALEPQLVREHEYRMAALTAETQTAKDKRALVKHMAGVAAGFVIALATLTGAVVLGAHDQIWLALALTGPSVFALVKIFVLRRATLDDLKQLRRMHNTAQQDAISSAPQAGGVPLV